MMILIILNKIRVGFALKNYLSILIFLLLPCWVYSQPTLEWEARYGDGEVLDMTLDRFGNVYVTGFTRFSIAGHKNFCTIKYNSSGQLQWVQTYNGPANLDDYANAIAVDDSGNVYVTGGSNNGMAPNKNYDWDYVTIKYNSSGVQQWIRIYNYPPYGTDIATAIALDENANVYVTGYYGITTIKYDRNGNQVWIAGPTAGGERVAYDLKYKSGFVYVTGYLYGSNLPDYLTIKYNSLNGSQVWLRTYNGTANSTDIANRVAVDASDNVYVAGSSGGIGTSYDIVTIKYNSSGILQWTNRYLGDSTITQQTTSDMVMDNAGNIYVLGSDGDYIIIKYNPTGSQQWVRTYDPGGNSTIPKSITTDIYRNVYATGYSQFLQPFFRDIFTIKYNESGVQQWVERYNRRQDRGNIVLVDSSLNVYIAGVSDTVQFPSPSNMLILKYSQLTGIQQISAVAEQFELFQNYPNPFNPGTYIKFGIPKSSNVVLSVYNQLGESVAELVNQKLDAGEYEYYFEASNLSSGVYYYRVTADAQTSVKKMILLK